MRAYHKVIEDAAVNHFWRHLQRIRVHYTTLLLHRNPQQVYLKEAIKAFATQIQQHA